MSAQDDKILEVITNIMPQLLRSMYALGFIGRHLHPSDLGEILETIGPADEPLRAQMERFEAIEWPEHMAEFKTRVELAAIAVCGAFDGLRAARTAPDGFFQAYKAFSREATACEALYPLAAIFQPVSRFFLDEAHQNNHALLNKLKDADVERENVGVMHITNELDKRGGFSVYVPEYYHPDMAMPVVMALHGGSGHGRSFLWSFVRQARARGVILISPTSAGPTWSIAGDTAGESAGNTDIDNIERMLGFVCDEWTVDKDHMLLTGMSDGGTFSYVAGLPETSPFTHLAPVSASFHPLLLEFVNQDRLKDLPVYLVHGERDWMFPVETAQVASKALTEKGADVTFRPIKDLSHAWPRDEAGLILDWLSSH